MFKLLTARSLGLGAACLLAWSLPADAFQITQINNQTVVPGAGTYMGKYVDFAGTTSVAGHFVEPTGTFGGVAGLKYHRIALANYGNGAANCFEVWTSTVTAPPPDTRIWFRPNSGAPALVSINDDAGSVHPKVRVYLQGQDAHVDLDIAAFDTRIAYNKGHFTLNVAKIPLGEVACTSGQAVLGWVKHIQAVGGAITESWQPR